MPHKPALFPAHLITSFLDAKAFLAMLGVLQIYDPVGDIIDRQEWGSWGMLLMTFNIEMG